MNKTQQQRLRKVAASLDKVASETMEAKPKTKPAASLKEQKVGLLKLKEQLEKWTEKLEMHLMSKDDLPKLVVAVRQLAGITSAMVNLVKTANTKQTALMNSVFPPALVKRALKAEATAKKRIARAQRRVGK